MFDNLKVAIVYDWIDKWGGVERLLLTLHEMFPKADFYSSYYDSEKAQWARDLKITTSFIQKLPKIISGSRTASLLLYPYAFESFDFSSYNLVISVSSSFAKAIITKPQTFHLCYLLTPTRFLWVDPKVYLESKVVRELTSRFITKLRRWDFIASKRPDYIVSISNTVAARTKKYYQRKSKVIYPPFDVEHWNKIKISNLKSEISNFPNLRGKLKNIKEKKYYLVVSRLEPYKRVDLAIRTFNKRQDLSLIIVGDGRMKNRLKRLAKNNIIFLSKLSDEELGYLYSASEAFIMPQEEDFGYTALEAQFFGCPVIAFKKGGAIETIINGKTGLFFDDQTVSSIQTALERFEKIAYNLRTDSKRFGAKKIEGFSEEKFVNKFQQFINSKLELLL